MKTIERDTAIAKYKNTATGETYELGFCYTPMITTPLARAWELVRTAAQMQRWNRFDVTVVSVNK